jgi:hypothetical protein
VFEQPSYALQLEMDFANAYFAPVSPRGLHLKAEALPTGRRQARVKPAQDF